MKIYLDFDGTVVEHQYPQIGKYNTGCFEVLKKLEKAGHKIVLNTYRADCADGTLQHAINYLEKKGSIKLDAIEERKITPFPWNWRSFRMKNLIFIDDICRGIPTKTTLTSVNAVVDWKALDNIFFKEGVYTE